MAFRSPEKLIIFYVFTILSLPIFSHAQSDSTAVIQLEEVKVSINRFEELRREQPAQIQRITSKDVEFQNSANTADLLINSGNIFVQKSQGGGGSPVLRGFEASRVLLVVDGIRMNNAIYRSGHLQNVLRVDQSMLEKTEILFGPASLLYGSDALGGVIAFTTKQPKLNDFSVNSFARYSSAIQEKTAHLDVNIGGKKIASLSSLTVSDFGDVVQGNWRRDEYPDFGKRFLYQRRESNVIDLAVENKQVNRQVESGYSQIDFLQKLVYQQNKDISHTFNLQFSMTGNVPRYDRLSEISNGQLRFAEWYYGPEKRLLSAYELRIKNRKLFDDSSIKFALQGIQESRINRRWNAAERFTQIEDVFVGSFNADFIKYANNSTTYNYGVEYVYNDVNSEAWRKDIKASFGNSTRGVSAATRYPDGGSQMRTAAAYVTAKQVIAADQLFVNYGARYSFNQIQSKFIDKTFFPFDFDSYQQNNGALVANAGITFTPNRKSKFTALFSNGFRVPNVDDLSKVFDSVPGQVVVPNPDVKPETTYSFEVGSELGIGRRLQVGATMYYTVFDNVIVLRPFELNGSSTAVFQGVASDIFANQNADNGRMIGGNINLTYSVSDELALESTYNFIRGFLTDENKTPLDHIPPNHGKTGLKYSTKRFVGELFSLYNGWKRIEDYSPSGEDNQRYATPEGMPSWWTLNLRTEYTVSKQLKVQAAVENLLDKNYRYFASGISAPGRNLILTLRANFD